MNYRILIVDDESDIREAVSEMIQLLDIPEGVEIDILEAENGEVALSEIKKHTPDLLITDLKMPKLEGNDLIFELSQNRGMMPKNVLVISGYIGHEPVIKKIDHVYFFPKPIAMKEVGDLIESFLGEHA